jgi:hypothetical protein
MSFLFLYKKNLEKNIKKLKYNRLTFTKKKHFLMCENCFWMVSTLPDSSHRHDIQYTRCPICAHGVYKFLV